MLQYDVTIIASEVVSTVSVASEQAAAWVFRHLVTVAGSSCIGICVDSKEIQVWFQLFLEGSMSN